ncbi:baseplate J/gp47 family protein [Actinopolymorpha rutila]|uniref:Baseplate assembly protein n=1 Tax=Actinopolymorpha rutila TaxID=446787 RepID=A0A852ZH86_9ACTN|nr:baseplate J/gp47 family protein [Actinopolymorpha rutila]NYH92447.1 hypothetical protein [Actinopolymorpha rutila]
MSDIVPDLDTIEFDQLVDLARGEIPRYAPDWTDHNLHDPGMTLVDLLAWVVDQQVFRAGFVGGRYRRAFAALLGQRPSGPTPARGLVWPAQPLPEGRIVQAGADVVCLQHLDVGFTLDVDAELYLPAVSLTGVGLTRDGDELLAPPAGVGSWDIGSPADTTVTLRFDGPLAATGPARVALGVEVASPPGPPPAPGDRAWGPVGYAYRAGAAGWVELKVVRDSTAGLARTGVVILAVPPAGTAAGAAELRLRFDKGFFPVAPQIRAVAINTLPVVQLRRDAPAVLGVGTGQPDQVIAVDTTDLVGPPDIRVGDDPWQARADLARSGPEDTHYVAFGDHLLFGNGVNGRRPELGTDIRHTGLVRTLGAGGNLRPGLTWSVPALGPRAYGQNRTALAGGADPTAPEDLARAARQVAVTRAALLTDAELAAAANGLTGMAVGRAEVLPRFDRRLPGRSVDGIRTLVVVPRQPPWSGRGRPPAPVWPAQAYLDEVATRLAPRRVLGERLVVQGPAVVAVDVAVTVTIAAGAVAGDVESAVQAAVHSRLAALAWPLGRDLTVVDVEALAADVPAVEQVVAVRVGAAGGPLGSDPVEVPTDGLVVAGQVEVSIGGGRAR